MIRVLEVMIETIETFFYPRSQNNLHSGQKETFWQSETHRLDAENSFRRLRSTGWIDR